MVLFIVVGRIKELLEWSSHAGAVYFDNNDWLLFTSILMFTSTETKDNVRPHMDMEYAAMTAVVTRYMVVHHRYPYTDFALKITYPSIINYYLKDLWCSRPESFIPDRICEPTSIYISSVGEHNLEPPKPPESLYTIVPTQLSGFI